MLKLCIVAAVFVLLVDICSLTFYIIISYWWWLMYAASAIAEWIRPGAALGRSWVRVLSGKKLSQHIKINDKIVIA